MFKVILLRANTAICQFDEDTWLVALDRATEEVARQDGRVAYDPRVFRPYVRAFYVDTARDPDDLIELSMERLRQRAELLRSSRSDLTHS